MPSEKKIRCRRSAVDTLRDIDENVLAHFEFAEHLSMADGTEAPASIDTRVGMEWNDNGLLIYVHGRYEQLRLAPKELQFTPNAKTHRLWEVSDVYEVFIGPNASQNGLYKEFQVSPDGRWIDIDVNRQLDISNHHWYSGLACRSFVDEEMKIWSSVIELPWNCFGSTKKTGDLWHVNFYRASGTFHGDELLAWSPTGLGPKCFHRPQHFGTILFEE